MKITITSAVLLLTISTLTSAARGLEKGSEAPTIQQRKLQNKGGGGGNDQSNKGGNGGDGGKRGSDNDASFPQARRPDVICVDYCDRYFRTCVNAQSFFDTPNPRGVPTRRNLIAMTEPQITRLDDDGLADAYEQCLDTCMLYPRPFDPAAYEDPADFGVNLGSDTLWCRLRHLSLAESNFTFDSAFHCPHAGPNGGGICRDAPIDGATHFEHLRSGVATHRHLGYCDLAADDTVAECTRSGITDAILPYVLSTLPSTVKILILNNNLGITSIPSGIFDNLRNPTGIKALIMEDCMIGTIAWDALNPLINLEVFNINQHVLLEYPHQMFSTNTKLVQFSAFSAGGKGGLITWLPEDLFSYTPDIENIVMYGQPGLTAFPPNIFRGLSKVNIISFVFCGFINEGFPDGVFTDLISLEWFDFFGNQLTSVENRWFEGNWAGNLLRLTVDNNPIGTVEPGAFSTMTNVEYIYLHNTFITELPMDAFANTPNLISYTIAPLSS